MLSSFIQSIIGLGQIYYPDFAWLGTIIDNNSGDVPQGSFHQVNVYASFITTGFTVCCYLYLFDNNLKSKTLSSSLVFMFVAVFSSAVILTGSRSAYISILLVMILMSLLAIKEKKFSRTIVIILALCIPAVLTIAAQPEGTIFSQVAPVNIENHTSNDTQIAGASSSLFEEKLSRQSDIRSQFYFVTLSMLKENLFTGIGYGQFQSNYTYYADKLNSEAQGIPLAHPHNFLLYIWAESGLIPLIIVLLAIGYAIYLAGVSFKTSSHNFLILIFMLPIGLHAMLELPFSHSIMHIVLRNPLMI